MSRRTKIVATIGPASDSPEVLSKLIVAGVNVFRLGTAHDTVDRVLERVHTIRAVAKEFPEPVGVLVDLAGPKVRAGFGDHPVELTAGSTVEVQSGTDDSSSSKIFVNVDEIAASLVVGDRLHMGDGSAMLVVTEVAKDAAIARVERGGIMRGRPGVHVPSSRLRTSSPTREDFEYFDAIAHEVDMVAVSFVKTGRDMRALHSERPPHGPMLIAKIETQAAVDNLESIIEHSDAVMVARGDLGLECSLPGLPALQKRIIGETVAAGKPVITATQMLESMTSASQPTRAEVTDVANAVFDGTSAVMLSGETAVGHNPVLVVETMVEILEEAERNFDHQGWAAHIESIPRPQGEEDETDTRRVARAMRGAAYRASAALGSRVVVTVTGTGRTARELSRYRPKADIVSISQSERVARQLCLSWGVRPMVGSSRGTGTRRVMETLAQVRDAGRVRPGELVPVVLGNSNSSLVSNVLRIENVPSD